MPLRKKKVTCIICPVSCIIDVKYTSKNIKKLKGNQCKKGKKYAEEEIFDPKRTLTTTVRVKNGVLPLVSVRTDKPVPKELIFIIMHEIMNITIKAPVKIGDVILGNVQNTGANIIATKTVALYKG